MQLTLSGGVLPDSFRERTAANQLYFYDEGRSARVLDRLPLTQLTAPAGGGTDQPSHLTTESYSDPLLTAKATMFQAKKSASYLNSNVFRIVSPTYTGEHYEATQGLIASSNLSNVCMSHTLAQAETYAQQFQASNNPLPGDAVLSKIMPQRATNLDVTPRVPCITGYVFVWTHQRQQLGGDAIMLGVSDSEIVTYTPNPPCPAGEVYDDENRVCIIPALPHLPGPTSTKTISYSLGPTTYYRLWRQFGAAYGNPQRHPLTAMDAYNAMLASPNYPATAIGTLQGFYVTYQTTSIDSLDNSAYPAYVFVFTPSLVSIAAGNASSDQAYDVVVAEDGGAITDMGLDLL